MGRWIVDIEHTDAGRSAIERSHVGALRSYLALRREGARFSACIRTDLLGFAWRFTMPDGSFAYLRARRPDCAVCMWPVEGEGSLCENCGGYEVPAYIARRRAHWGRGEASTHFRPGDAP